MHLFRKLAGNIFFKIILAFVALTFVLFGVSGFILGNPGSWVVKIGNKTISYNTFNKVMQSDRDMILSANKGEEALKYLESEQFRSDVLARLVNKIMIEKLHEEYGISASPKLILSAVAKDEHFRKDGKFDREAFKAFLAKNGLNEEKYVNAISNEVVATMIIQTISLVAPVNDFSVIEAENFKEEKRKADLITISLKDVKTAAQPSEEEIDKFYAANKKKYFVPEIRKVSYLYFSKKDFNKDLAITDAEVLAEYEKNKDQFQKPESRNFYHILFEDEKLAKEFVTKLDVVSADKTKIQAEFIKLAEEFQKKDKKAITLSGVTKKDLIPELADNVFKIAIGSRSEVLSSPLGFHVFLLNDIKPASPIPFAEVKNTIKQQLAEGREMKVLQAKVSEIDDSLLTSNSLAETAKKFGLKTGANAVKIDQAGQDSNGGAINEIKDFEGFAANSFAAKKDQVSKVFYNKDYSGYYAIKVEEIEAARDRELSEVKTQVVVDLLRNERQKYLHELAKKVSEEVQKNPDKIAQIAAENKVKFEANREFPRVVYIEFQGRKVAYPNKFLDVLFATKLGAATPAVQEGQQEFVVAVVREVKKPNIALAQISQGKKEAMENFRSEILQEFNSYIVKKHPVKVNDKAFAKNSDNDKKE